VQQASSINRSNSNNRKQPTTNKPSDAIEKVLVSKYQPVSIIHIGFVDILCKYMSRFVQYATALGT